MPTPTPDRSLRLDPIAGPPLAPVVIAPDRPAILGRAVGSEVLLLSEGVSRRHAQIQHQSTTRAGSASTTLSPTRWYLTDLNSSPGTFVNGVRLAPDAPTALTSGDLLRIGPWTFRVVLEGAALSGSRIIARTLDDTRSTPLAPLLPPHPPTAPSPGANQRLDQLIDCTLNLMDAPDVESMARVVLDAALSGTGFTRGAILSSPADDAEVEIIHSAGSAPDDWTRDGMSRSLIRSAAAGHPASIVERSTPSPPFPPSAVSAHTIGELRIHSAVCVPVIVGPTVVSLLYLDARAEESRVGVRADAESFCSALGRMYGMAIGNAMRADLDHRRASLESDLGAAREAQQLVMPTPDATLGAGRVRYAVRNIPGRFVAGDLFDAFDLGSGRVAISIGDVSGEGAGSAIVMASAQAYLHAALRREPDLAAAVAELNRYVCQHSPLDRFVSCWVGIIDTAAMTLTYADAGHGHWLIRRADGSIEHPRAGAGIPLGIEPEYTFLSSTIPIHPRDRLILYSDGLLEQQSPSGEEFGPARITSVIAPPAHPTPPASAAETADALMLAVQTHADRPFLDDDTTVASVELL